MNKKIFSGNAHKSGRCEGTAERQFSIIDGDGSKVLPENGAVETTARQTFNAHAVWLWVGFCKPVGAKENDMATNERWAMTDVSREDVTERLGFEVTDAEWEEICSEVYEDAKDALLDVVEEVADRMECVNAPA